MALALMALMALMAVQSEIEALERLTAAVKHLENTAKDAAERCTKKFSQMKWQPWHRISLDLMPYPVIHFPVETPAIFETQAMKGMQLRSRHYENSWVFATAKGRLR